MSYLRTVCIEVKIFMKLREYCFLFGQSRCYCTEKLKHCNNTTLLVGNQGEFLENILEQILMNPKLDLKPVMS